MKIVYRSSDGRYSDNPRALHEGLLARGEEHEHVWMCEPGRERQLPPGTAAVSLNGPDAVAAVESAQLVVASTHLRFDWTKSPRTTYLQTWHGTPLKVLHRQDTFQPQSVPQVVDRDVARWDLLLSQNAESAPLLRAAFGYEGPIASTGYPRNDVLLAPDAPARRNRVRADLGIPAGATAVLYAPDARPHLEPAPFAERLGPDHVLLVRLNDTVDEPSRDVAGAIDVSDRPDLRDLYLAADVLVTDYSSAPFDFALTGKPIVYFVPDLDHYRADVRSFYFDLPEIAPGPLLYSPDDLVAALHDLDDVASRYRERYARFRERFGHLDDGQATGRVLQLVDRIVSRPGRR